MLLISNIVLFVSLIFLVKMLPYRVFSPVYFLVLFHLIALYVGYYIYSFTGYADGVLFDLGSLVNQDELDAVFFYIVYLVFVFVCGVVFYLICNKMIYYILSNGNRFGLGNKSAGINIPQYNRKYLYVYVAVIIFPLLSLVVGFGLNNILFRDEYLAEKYHVLVVAGKILGLLSILLLGYLFKLTRNFSEKIFYIVMLSLYFILFMSLGSRRLALVPALFLLGMLLAKGRKKISNFSVFVFVISAFVLIQVSLLLRAQPFHGLKPYLAYIFSDAFFNDVLTPEMSVFSLLTIVFSVPLTAYVAFTGEINLNYLFVSINPMPSQFTEWSLISGELRLNKFVPYTGVGELLNYGIVVASIYYFIVGLLFCRMDLKIRSYMSDNYLFLVMLYFGLSAIFVVTLWQYNLRSATRLLYYMLFFEILVWGAGYVQLLMKKHVKCIEL